MSSKKRINIKKRPQRATSNVFAMFDSTQIQELKEAFNMIDQDKDGYITKDDLQDIFASLGKNQTDEMVNDMLNEASGPINFTMFLTLFGVKLNGTDSEDVVRSAFSLFDTNNTGFISEDCLREAMTTMGDRFTNEEFEELISGMEIKNGMVDYKEFCGILKNGSKSEAF